MGKYSMNSGKDFSPIPEDKYTVEIYAAEIFTGTKFQSTEEAQRLKITFVILDEDKKMPEEGKEVPVRGRRLWARTSTVFSPPGSKKSTNLTKLVAAAYGHELEEAETSVFDETDLLGKQLCVMIDAKAAPDGKVWNNVLSYSKATKELPKWDELEGTKHDPKVKESKSATAGDDFEKSMDEAAAKK